MTTSALDAAIKRAGRIMMRHRSNEIDVDKLSDRQLMEEYARIMQERGAPHHLLPTESEYQDAFWGLSKVFDRLNSWWIEHSTAASKPSTRPAAKGRSEADSR